jgi:glycosyltransferase involved in cell wall biosynthesis
MYDPGYSRSWTYYSQLSRTRANVFFHKINSKNLFESLREIKKLYPTNSIFVISSPSQYLTFFSRIALSNQLYLDAGWSLFEGTVISRKRFGLFGATAIKNYLVDFISSHLVKGIFVESELQKLFYSRLFFVRKSKIEVIYTGVDEFAMSPNMKFKPPTESNQKVVLFRGKYNPEAGVEVLAKATFLLEAENISFWVFCPGLPSDISFGKNTYVDTGFHSKSEFASLYAHALLSLGQLSNHPRLSRTIPHKAYEAAYTSTAYITARSQGILELFKEDHEILCFEPGNAQDLASKIFQVCFSPHLALEIGSKMNIRYLTKCSQSSLANEFLAGLGIANE